MTALKSTRDAIDAAYGKVWAQAHELHVGRAGTLDEIVQFAVSATKAA